MDSEEQIHQLTEAVQALSVQVQAAHLLHRVSGLLFLEVLEQIQCECGVAQTGEALSVRFDRVLIQRVDAEIARISDDDPTLASRLRAYLKE